MFYIRHHRMSNWSTAPNPIMYSILISANMTKLICIVPLNFLTTFNQFALFLFLFGLFVFVQCNSISDPPFIPSPTAVPGGVSPTTLLLKRSDYFSAHSVWLEGETAQSPSCWCSWCSEIWRTNTRLEVLTGLVPYLTWLLSLSLFRFTATSFS